MLLLVLREYVRAFLRLCGDRCWLLRLQLAQLEDDLLDEVEDLRLRKLALMEVQRVALFEVRQHLIRVRIARARSQLHLVVVEFASGRDKVLEDCTEQLERLDN